MDVSVGSYRDELAKQCGYKGWVKTKKEIIWIDNDDNFGFKCDVPEQEMTEDHIYELFKIKVKKEVKNVEKKEKTGEKIDESFI
jgi:hypothetical protein